MVQILKSKSTIEHEWEHVCMAVWLKYPNPISSHVLSSDVLERRVDETTGKLFTKRLFLKEAKIPRWATKVIVILNQVC